MASIDAAATGRESGAIPRETPHRRLLADRLARWVVRGGGIAIIVSILGILAFIVVEILPFLGAAEVGNARVREVASRPEAAVADEYRTRAAGLASDGTLSFVDLATGEEIDAARLTLPGREGVRLARIENVPGSQAFQAATDDGAVVWVPVRWSVRFDGSERRVEGRAGDVAIYELDPTGAPVGPVAARGDDEGNGGAAGQRADGTLAVALRTATTNLFTEETTVEVASGAIDAPPLRALQLDGELRNLYAATEDGRLLWWTLDGAEPRLAGEADAGSPVRTLSLLIGDRSLIAGHDDGVLSVWFKVRQPDESFALTRIRTFPPLDGPIERIAPSFRNKGFAARAAGGDLGLFYSTSRRVLWRGAAPLDDAGGLFLTPKADGLLLSGAGRLALLDVDNPHPEISLRSLFGKVWYEGRPEPEYVWQSTGGTDDFEPKLSLTPLIVGTLKGTVYSLFLAIPLGVLGAMYTAHFVHPRLKQTIKPIVEVMASLPSVVLGFLAGLWLAPRVQQIFPGLVLMLLLLPVAVLLTGYAWRGLPRAVRNRFPVGVETGLYMVVLALAMWLAIRLSGPLEAVAFDGDFRRWLLEATGLVYDQLNALVVGLAMGFAVIPIIFSIAEDAFSNVPQNLVSGSLALGANRWQTVTRVVLPTASPGIFSAIMIGFGRAIGETMIVVMATGNTPILDWSPFNGFRTLSANIAVEIPEAPHGGTLYRTLFLAALLLFVFTFVLNTVAEVVRQRLRTRYAHL